MDITLNKCFCAKMEKKVAIFLSKYVTRQTPNPSKIESA